MIVVLDKDELIDLVTSASPYYLIMDMAEVKPYGRYIGGFHDKWEWSKDSLSTLSEEQLYSLYMLCKVSWKTS